MAGLERGGAWTTPDALHHTPALAATPRRTVSTLPPAAARTPHRVRTRPSWPCPSPNRPPSPENLYVSSDTITEKGLTTLKDAWETQGQLWAGGNKRDGVHPSTFRRKPLTYNPTPEERMAMLPDGLG